MAIEQAIFVGPVISYPESFGIYHPSRSELDDYVFFWRCIGYLLGIRDEFNMCSRGLDTALEICSSVETDLILPGLMKPPSEFHPMANAYFDGINSLFLQRFRKTTKESIIAYSFEIAKAKCNVMLPPWLRLSFLDYFRIIWLKMSIFLLKYLPGFEKLLNWMLLNGFLKRTMPLVSKQLDRQI